MEINVGESTFQVDVTSDETSVKNYISSKIEANERTNVSRPTIIRSRINYQ